MKRISLILLLLCIICISGYGQSVTSNEAEESEVVVPKNDKVQQLLDKLNSPEAAKRADAAKATYEKIKQASNYIGSISDLFKNKEIPLPVGIKSESNNYTICIEQFYRDDQNGIERHYIKAVCVIPLSGDGSNSLAFDGIVELEGDYGIGTHGKLSLIQNVEMPLGEESSIVYCEGSTISFACGGFENADVKLAFVVKSDKIYTISKDGNPKGRLMFETEAHFADFDDFVLSLNAQEKVRIKGLDGFTIELQNLTWDQSCVRTPATVQFPNNYFTGVNLDQNRNIWQGLAISKASLSMPDFFSKQAGKTEPIVISMDGVLIDGEGLTCYAKATNVIGDGALDPEQWSMSINGFELSVVKGNVQGAGFNGKINIPPFGENSLLNYSALYNIGERAFIFNADLNGKKDFPILCGNLTFDETSKISLKINDDGVYPTILANGLLSLEVPMSKSNSSKSKLDLPDLRFENMVISREAPYFDLGTIALTSEAKTPDMAGYSLTLKTLKSINDSKGKGIYVEAGVKLTEMFGGDAGINLYGDEKKWKFSKLSVGKINVDYKGQAFKISGGVEFKDADETYGKGFRGEVKFDLINKFKLDAVAVFGKKDNYRYFLTDAFLEFDSKSGILLPPALNFYGIGGGLYRHMQQSVSGTSSEFGKTLTGLNYIPDNKVGMGFMARTKFNLMKNSALFDADVSLELQFNKDWGVNFVQLRGEATMISKEQQEKMLGSMKKGFEQIEAKSGQMKDADGNKVNCIEFDKKALDCKPSKDGALTATLGIKFDMANDVFTADLKTYLDVAGALKGRGANNSMGWASAYFAKDKWYTYIGTPDDRLGVSLLGIADAGGYFMVGNDVPEMTIPKSLEGKIPSDYLDKLRRNDAGKLTSGSGLAFGTDLSVKFDANLPPFYAHLGVGMGTDMLLKKYSDAAHCRGMSGPIGVNGWYAQAQAYAWVDASIGIKVKLFKKTRQFEIIDAEMAAFLRGAGPNPYYFTGAVGGKFSVLGGLVHGHCNFDFTVGEQCKIEGGSPFGEDVISQLTPADKSKDVNVFTAPQLVLNIPADEEMEIEDEDGIKETYRVSVAEFSVKNMKSGALSKCSKSVGEEGRVLTYELDEPLESQTLYNVYAKVAFQRKEGNKWVDVMDEDAKPYYEEKVVEFNSGDRPKYIMPEHVKYAYPADRQYNFLSKEHNEAYLMVSENYSYLFTTEKPEGFDQQVELTSFDGQKQVCNFSYKTVSDVAGVKFEVDIPTTKLKFKTNEIYNMAIVNVPQRTVLHDENIVESEKSVATEASDSEISSTTYTAEGNLEVLEQTEIYAMDFRTSSYETFKEKMGGFSVGEIAPVQEYPFVYNLKTNIVDNSAVTENFDYVEYDNDSNTGNIIIQPVYDDMPWYTNHVKSLIYGNNDLCKLIGNIAPPINKEIFYWHSNIGFAKLSDDIIGTGTRINMGKWNSLNNHMQKYIDNDFCRYRTIVADKLVNGVNKTDGIRRFFEANNIPPTINGRYPVLFKYILPGKNIKTSEYKINLNL